LTKGLFPLIPPDTANAVRPVFGGRNFYIAIGNQLNQLFHGLSLTKLKQADQEPARALAELYLITIFQYLETLPDNQAAEAVRDRRDWKYALHLPLNVIGFPASTFCEFRRMLLSDRDSLQTLQTLLGRLAEVGVSINGESLKVEANQMITRVCLFSQLANTWETINQTMEVLALRQPEWLRTVALPHWYDRYRYKPQPINYAGTRIELEAFTQTIGADGSYILEAISESNNHTLDELPEVEHLRQVWQAQYDTQEGKTVWRGASCAGCIFLANDRNKLENEPNANGGGNGMSI
jgi:transposase